jgi:uncharacterized protein YndB with AHSA1/START domain
MGHIETRFTVAAPPARVFDLVVDPERFPEWQTMTLVLLSRNGPADAIGASFTARYRVLGRDLHGRFVVTAVIRPYLYELTGTTRGGWARWSTHIEPDPASSGAVRARSLVRVELEYRLPGDLLGGFLGLLAHPVLTREVDRTYERLRDLAEAAEATEAGATRPSQTGIPPSVS